MSALPSFRDWPIAAKLNVVQFLSMGVLLAIAITALVLWLGLVLEEKSLESVRQSNQQAIDMLAVYNSATEQSAERLGEVLAARYPDGFSLDEGAGIAIGGIVTPLLRSGDHVLNLDFAIVDDFTATTQAVATLFARTGDDFVRVATSLKKEDGERAVGTLLGSAHPAHARLLQGEPYTGKANLFGRDYMTRYLPQRDASGRVVAVLLIGLDFTRELAFLKERIGSIRLGRTGYIFAVDAGEDRGTLVIHPAQEGANLLEARDASGVAFIREMVDGKAGTIRYLFTNPGERRPRDKVVPFGHFAPWNWVVGASLYRDDLMEEASAVRNRLIIGAIVLGLSLLLVSVLVVRRWVSRPLADAVVAIQHIASGNLAVHIPPQGKDESGLLLNATRTMAGNMSEAIASIQTAARQVGECADHLSETTREVAAKSGLQSEAATSMAAAIEEMNASIGHVAENSQNAREISASSGQVSSEGTEVIQQTVGSMTRIAGAVRDASATVTQLGEESQAISAIIDVIKGIAGQTNLLALNAAIEAARAGEAGRGFAVVADEVRKLAERTSLSTQEIEGMIGRIQDGTSEAVCNMETGVRQVEEGVTFATQAGGSIADIRLSADQVSRAVNDISEALAQQTTASHEIAENVARIAAMANENNFLVQNSAGYAEELKQLAASLNQRASRFVITG